MNVKKIMSALLASLMIATLAACGAPAAPSSSSAAPSSDSSSAAPSAPSSTISDAAAAGDTTNAAGITFPDVSKVDMAALDAQIKELAAKVKTGTPGKLIVGTSADFAPYEFHVLQDGKDQIVGFDVALGKAIAAELGVECEVKDISFDSILIELNAGTIDIGLAGFSPTPERLAAVDMTYLYYTGGQSLMIKKADADKYKSFADFVAGTSVGAQTGSIQADLAKANTPNASLVTVQTVPSVIMDLKTGKIGGAYIETVVAEGYIKTQQDLAILCDVPYDSKGSAAAIKKGNDDLKAFANAVITKVVANGDMDKFVQEANTLSEQAVG